MPEWILVWTLLIQPYDTNLIEKRNMRNLSMQTETECMYESKGLAEQLEHHLEKEFIHLRSINVRFNGKLVGFNIECKENDLSFNFL